MTDRATTSNVPSTVYRRRRIVAIGIVAVVFLFGFEVIHRPGGGPSLTAVVAAGDRPTRLVASLVPWKLAAPVSRAVVAVEPSGQLDILGGLQTGDSSTGAIWRADPSRGSVRRSGSLPIAVHDAGGAFFKGKAYVVAGGSFTTVATVQAFSNGTASETGSLPIARSDLAVAVVKGAMYVVGGFDGVHLVSDILKTTDGVHFTRAGTLVQAVRYPAVAVANGQIWVVGGQQSTSEGTIGGPQTAAIQRFDPLTGSTELMGRLPQTLGHAMAVAVAGSLYVLGGRSGSVLSSSVWKIDLRSSAVTYAGHFAYPRSDAGVAVVGRRAYLIGGETSGPSAPLDSVIELQQH